MGYFKDEHWIIEGDSEALKNLRNEIIDEINKAFAGEEGALNYSDYLSPVLYGLANGYSCLFFMPADGSKEGWTTSNLMDEVREETLKKVILNNAKNPHDRIQILRVTVDEFKNKPEADWVVETRQF